MRALKVEALKYKYSQNNNFAVDDVSFQIEKGSYTAIVGLNGSGKSTLARLLCGLEQPQTGNIYIEGNPRIGIIFQSPKDQIVSGIVYRDTEFGPLNLHLTPAEVELRTIESLNVVEMLDRADSSTTALSLGQTQKIALSGIIALNPDILILDEAIAMLDPVSRADILEFLRYWHKNGNTIIHITHDVDAIKESERIIGMERGKIYFDGLKKDFFADGKNVNKIEGNKLVITDKKKWNNENKTISFNVKNITFNYDNNIGVKNVSFNLYKGSITALTGPSGAGKSTILELCSGVLKPSSGNIYTASEKKPVLAQQNSQSALFETFAADDVAFGPKNAGIKGNNLKEIVQKSMELSHLPFESFAERKTFCLSGGEQRRLSIAGILAMDSDILFFDEPTAGLDSVSRFNVLNMFRKLAEEGKTIVFSTHKNDEADFADREIRIERGEIIKDTLESNSYDKELNSFVELKPYDSQKMLESLRKTSATLAGSGHSVLSPVQKLPSWLRILLFLTLFIFSLCGQTPTFCAAFMCISAVYAMASGLLVKTIAKTCIKILPWLILFGILQMIFHPALEDETVYFSWNFLIITPSKLLLCLCTLLRTFAAINCICGFYISTPEYDLIDGLKILLKPLEVIKIPVRYIILILEVIFRFIPLLIDEAACIIKTQLIRGGLGKTKGKISRIKCVLPLIVPMLIQTIKRSEALADAITVRCFK